MTSLTDWAQHEWEALCGEGFTSHQSTEYASVSLDQTEQYTTEDLDTKWVVPATSSLSLYQDYWAARSLHALDS
ncbi:MAG: hypothetical protein MZV63_20235 [Marinilabiliales bacterium]|nr:hypothetical protein [Marinilabiliales bacterium]